MPSNRARTAAEHLHQKLGINTWLSTVGVGLVEGRECLYVYASRLGAEEKKKIPSTWEGFPVQAKKIGAIRITA